MGPLTWSFLTWDWVVGTIIVELAVVMAGVVFANLGMRRWKERKWGDWRLLIRHGQELLLDRALSSEKSERVFSDETDMDIFLKGRVSVFGRVQCDLISELQRPDSQVVQRSNQERIITIWIGTPSGRDRIGIEPLPAFAGQGAIR